MPRGIVVNTIGKIAISDYIGHCVYMFDKEGDSLRNIGSQGENAGQFKFPFGVVYSNGNEIMIMIADHRNHRTQKVDVQTETVVKAFEENLMQQKESLMGWLIFAWMNSTTLL